MKKLCLILLSIIITQPVLAYYCSEPSEPYCLNGLTDFRDEWSFRRCKDEVEQYAKDMANWVECQQKEAIEKTNKVLEKFNCRARGDNFCY